MFELTGPEVSDKRAATDQKQPDKFAVRSTDSESRSVMWFCLQCCLFQVQGEFSRPNLCVELNNIVFGADFNVVNGYSVNDIFIRFL